LANDQYTFAVTDTGPGIEPQWQEAVFDAFQQQAEGVIQGGTGLGLAIARRHVELLGGRLALESKPGEGSRFYFTLSLSPADEALEQGPVRHGSRVADTARIAPTPSDWHNLSLPAKIYDQLKAAIDIHSITQLRQQLDALGQLGPEWELLAAHLGNLTDQYNMSAIRQALEKIDKG